MALKRIRIAAAVAAVWLAIAGPAQAQTQATAGGVNTSTGNGFGCAAGTTYQMVNGMARCTQPTATALTAAACGASVLTQDACSFSFPATTSGSTPSVSTSTAGYTGQAHATCSNGTWAGVAGTCGPNPCNAATTSYGACSFSFPSVASGSSPSVATSTPGYTGTAQAICSAGSWGGLSASCAPSNCRAATTTYGSCTFSVPPLSAGASTSVTTSTGGYTGSITASCSTGSLSFSGQSCAALPPPSPPPAPCSSGMLSWGGGCNASVASTSSGSSASVSNVATGYSGSATFSCSNGVWSAGASSCSALPCSSGTVSWNGSCSGSIPATGSGSSATVTNTVAGFSGSATFACSYGTWQSPTSVSCAASCGAGTMHWGTGCSAPIAAVASGSSSTLANVATGYSGSASFACTNGVWGSPTGATCASSTPPPVPCPANIWLRNDSISVPLSNASPTDKLPNGNAYCRYQRMYGGDLMVGVFDRVVGKAVDFFPIFQEYPDSSGNTANSFMGFTGYEPRYSSNLHIQGAYCANNQSDPNQNGFYPGTCISGGNGGFAPMCFIQVSSGSTVGAAMASQGLGNRLMDGGDIRWGAYQWAVLQAPDTSQSYYDPGSGATLSSTYWTSYYTDGRYTHCRPSNPQPELPVLMYQSPPPQN